MKKTGLIAIGVVLLVVVMVGSSYNGLVSLDQAVRAQSGQVENVYQRRSDLVPNLVETVKGAAAFEKETFTKVAEARAKVVQISGDGLQKTLSDPKAFKRFQQAQGDVRIVETQFNGTAIDWAREGGHPEIAERLEAIRR